MALQSSKCGDFHGVGAGVGRGLWVNGLTIISMWRLPLCVEEGWSYNHISVETPIVCEGKMALQSSVWRLPLCVEDGWSYNHLNVETSIVW